MREGGLASAQADAVAADIARAHGIAVSAPGFPRWDDEAAAPEDGGPASRWPVPKVTGRFLAPFLRDLVAGPAAQRQITTG